MKIDTKQIRTKWYCFATIDCYDHSFKGDTIKEAQEGMKALLIRKGITGAIFTEPKHYVYVTSLPTAPIRYARFRVDRGMVEPNTFL